MLKLFKKMMGASAKNSGMRVMIKGRIFEDAFNSKVQAILRAEHFKGWMQSSLEDSWMLLELEGSRDTLEKALNQIHQSSSSLHIKSIDFEWVPYTGKLGDFRVRL